ncbi:hypothetical protein FALCPG4_003842 [Fusarium falciforme]
MDPESNTQTLTPSNNNEAQSEQDPLTSITNPVPLAFEGSSAFATDSKGSYEVLTAMADHVWQAVHIAIYDGESLFALHCKDLCRLEDLRSSRLILDHICDKEEEDGAFGDSDQATLPHSREDFFNFVNYCTAVLARALCAAVDGKSFYINIVAHLAKMSTKVKVVSTRLQECAQTAIDYGIPDRKIPVPNQYDIRGRQGNNPMMGMGLGDINLDFEPLLESVGGLRGEIAAGESPSKKDSIRHVYFLQCNKYRTGILGALRFLLVSLRGTNNLMSKSVTSYELCSMVYGTGFERFRTLVYQDRENNFSGTSDVSMINCARNSFDLLDKTIRHVQGSASPCGLPRATTLGGLSGMDNQLKSVDSRNSSVGTRISWSYATDGNSSGSLQARYPLMLRSMSQVITVMVPLIMTRPTIVCFVSEFITMAIFAEFLDEREMNPIKPRVVGMYTAFFCLTTAEYDAAQRSRGPEEPGPLSKALMRRNNLLAGRQLADIGREKSFAFDSNSLTWQAPSDGDDQTTPERIQRHQLELDRFSKKMKAWIFEEKGVMVRCRLYVWMLMLLCAVLVAGGVSIGVAVGERITGVDPFNITTYCWVLAAFILLVAKSARVQNWPWNDFLHGRVLCKSVSELSSVTGVNEQLILAKLLQDESISILQTRGPYNAVFTRKSEDGFSIDRPLSTWTMLLSGLIMIEVDTVRGRGLVCLDLRRGTKYRMIQNMCIYEPEGNKFIYCPRLSDEKDQEAHGDPNRIRLGKGKLVWLRALGFYGNKHAKFV